MNSSLSLIEAEITSISQNKIDEFRHWLNQYSNNQEVFGDNDYIHLQDFFNNNCATYYNNLKYILTLSSSSIKLQYKESKEEYSNIISKYFFFYVSFHYFINQHNQNKKRYLVHFIIKLYKNTVISFNDIEKLIIKFAEVSVNTPKKQLRKLNLLLFSISLFIQIVKSQKCNLNFEAIDSITRISSYLQLNILSNNTNCDIINKKSHLLNMLLIANTISNNKITDHNPSEEIINILVSIYSFNYSDVIIKLMIKKVKRALIHINEAKEAKIHFDISLLRIQLYFILKMILKEENTNQIKAGFVFNDSPDSGIMIFNINLRIKHNIILFSFNQHSQKNDEKGVIFNASNSKHLNLITCYIKNSFLHLQFGKNIQKIQYSLELNTDYYVYIYICKSLLKSATVKVKINAFIEEFRMGITSEDADLLTFGYINKDRNSIKYNTQNFIGVIGPLLYYNCIFEENDIERIYQDYTHYKGIISNSKYNTDNSPDLEHNKINSAYTSYMKYKDYLGVYVNPYSVINAFKSKKEYSDNYNYSTTKHKKDSNLFNNIKYYFNSHPIPNNFDIYPFVKVKTISQFIEYDGIDFMILNVEYYYTLIRSLENNSEILSIVDNM